MAAAHGPAAARHAAVIGLFWLSWVYRLPLIDWTLYGLTINPKVYSMAYPNK